MSISDQINQLTLDKTAIANAIVAKNGTVNTGDGFDNFADDIATIPTGITPTGTISITENGTHNVTNYASADVNVSANVKDISPITKNGTYTAPDFVELDGITLNTSYFAIPLDLADVQSGGLGYDLETEFTTSSTFPTYGAKPFSQSASTGSFVIALVKSDNLIGVSTGGSSKDISYTVSDNTTYKIKVKSENGVQNVYINDTFVDTLTIRTTKLTGFSKLYISGSNTSSNFTGVFKYLKIYNSGGATPIHHLVTVRNSSNTPFIYNKSDGQSYSITGTDYVLGQDAGTIHYDGFASPLTVNVPTSKYGATIDSLLGDVDSSGTYQKPTEATNLDFTGIITVSANGLENKFRGMTNVGSISFPDLTTVNDYGLSYFAQGSSATSFSAPNLATIGSYGMQYGMQGDTSFNSITLNSLTTIGNYGMQYFAQNCTALTGEITLNSLTTVGLYGMRSGFYGTKITKFEANNLISVSNYAFNGAFENVTGAIKVYFNGLTAISANYTFYYLLNSSYASECEFNNLESISGSNNFYQAFRTGPGNIYRGEVWHCMPKLKTIDGSNNFNSAFAYTYPKRIIFDSLESIGATTASTQTNFQNACNYVSMTDENNIDKQGMFFPALKTIGQASTYSNRNFINTFYNTGARHSMHFYELTTVYNTNSGSSNGQFYSNQAVRIYMPKVTDLGTYNQYCFRNSTNTLQIHFGKENQATIEAMGGYSSKFGATNATIYFDMINHITVGGVVYDRDGAKCDLDNWYFAYTDADDNTIYVTNFNDPAVGNTTYTKSGTTYVAGTTIEAVA